MTDEQQGGIGCLIILLVIGGCYFLSSDKQEQVDANQLFDDVVCAAQEEAAVKIDTLKNAYEKQKRAREERYSSESAKLLNQIEIERRRDEAAKKIVRERDTKEDELRTFAMKESPSVWKILQTLSAERETLSEKIKGLEDTLKRFGKDPDADEDVIKLKDCRSQLDAQISLVNGKLESAYLAAKKYEAMPHRKDFNDLMHKSIEDGISAAELAEKRYKELKEKEIGQ